MDKRLALSPLRLSLVAVAFLNAPWVAEQMALASPEEIPAEAAKAFEAGDFRRAAHVLERAYREHPSSRTLYAWAQSERMSGDCERASELYRQLLAEKLSDQDRLAAESGLRECDAGVEGDDPEMDAQPASPSGGTLDTSDSPGSAEDPLIESRLPGLLTAGAGVIALAAAGGLYWNARTIASDAETAPDAVAYDRELARAESRRNWAIGAASVGGLLAITGIVLYALADDREGERLSVGLGAVGLESAHAQLSMTF